MKSELGILADDTGTRLTDYDISIEQDELIITDRHGDIFEYKVSDVNTSKGFKVRPDIQKFQSTLFHEKQKIIENCLFGVDINQNSVKICRLRLWIELLKNAYYKYPSESQSVEPLSGSRSDEPFPGSRSDEPPPGPLLKNKEGEHENVSYKFKEGVVSTELETLPNIDINIKCGNSLISRFALDANLSKYGQNVKDIVEQYRENVRDYKNEKNRNKKKEIDRLINSLKSDIRTTISKNDPKLVKLNKLKSELDNMENQSELFDQSKKDLKDKDVKKKKLQKEIIKLNTEVEDIRSNAIYRNAFEWRFEFPEVLNEDGEYEGFDVVISNPPYIRQESLGFLKEYLKDNYEVYVSGGDLFSYFYEMSYNILKMSGMFTFVNNTFDKTTAGAVLREFIVKHFQLRRYIDFTDVVVFDEATTYPIILSAIKNYNSASFKYFKFNKDNFKTKNIINDDSTFIEIKQSSLNDSAWNFLSNLESDLLAKIKKHKSLFDIYGKSYRGIITGLNEAFILGNYIIDSSILKPIYEGKDLSKWLTPDPTKIIIAFQNKSTSLNFEISDEEDALNKMKSNYLEIINHLMPYSEAAKKRYDKGEYWWELRNCSYYNLFEQPKIVFPNLQNTNKFALDLTGAYINAPAVFFPTDDKYLLAILNSKVAWHFLKSICVIRSGGYIEVKPQYVEQIPIPEIDEKDKTPFINLVDKILESKKQNKDTTSLEAEIDRMVYELYGLTEEEVRVVEGDKVNTNLNKNTF